MCSGVEENVKSLLRRPLQSRVRGKVAALQIELLVGLPS